MKRSGILAEVHEAFKPHIDPSHRDGMLRFFREDIKVHGVRGTNQKLVASALWKRVKGLDRQEIMKLCDALMASRYIEDKSVALNWAFRLKRSYDERDFARFSRWMAEDVDNWATCDDLCTHPLGELLCKHPELIGRMSSWPKSSNRWLRRGSAVALIRPNRRGLLIPEAYRTADILLKDDDDMVQKGFGWMLKELWRTDPVEVERFVLERRGTMPRTALRYAIERMPEPKRKELMARD